MPTQRDIAKKTGLSQTTISLALKGHPRIPEETRNTVLAAAEKIGYRPNPYVQALMSSRRPGNKNTPTYPVLLYISDCPVGSPGIIGQTRTAAGKAAEQLGFVIEHMPTPKTTKKVKALRQVIKAKNIRGVILGPIKTREQLPDLPWEHLAVIAISDSFRSSQVDRIGCDHYLNLRLALEKLVANGSKRPGIIYQTEINETVNRVWSAQFLDFAHKHSNELELPTPLELDTIDPQVIQDWNTRERPDAILFFPNTLLEVLITLPPPLPTLAMMQWQDFKHPNICGIDVKAETIGALAVREVTSRILRSQFGLNPNPQITRIPGSWKPISKNTTLEKRTHCALKPQ